MIAEIDRVAEGGLATHCNSVASLSKVARSNGLSIGRRRPFFLDFSAFRIASVLSLSDKVRSDPNWPPLPMTGNCQSMPKWCLLELRVARMESSAREVEEHGRVFRIGEINHPFSLLLSGSSDQSSTWY
jgi:hypothetical protein